MKTTIFIRISILLFLTATIPLNAQVDITSGLIAYYPFNAKDEINTNHGLVFGTILTEDRFGDKNKAYEFDGIDDYKRLHSF